MATDVKEVKGTSEGFTFGVDLGQSQDYSTLGIIETIAPPLIAGEKTPQKQHNLQHLERWPLGTLYPEIVASVKGRFESARFSGRAVMLIDRTGVGAAVADMFQEQGLRPISVTIHGGDEVSKDGPFHYKIPKRELVGTLVALYQSGRLNVAPGLKLGPTLVKELGNFKVKISLTTGHDSYEAYREGHDDLVLAVALACWYSENKPPPPPMPRFVAYPTKYRAGTPHGWPSSGKPPGYR